MVYSYKLRYGLFLPLKAIRSLNQNKSTKLRL
jgi:hypothetical protein